MTGRLALQRGAAGFLNVIGPSWVGGVLFEELSRVVLPVKPADLALALAQALEALAVLLDLALEEAHRVVELVGLALSALRRRLRALHREALALELCLADAQRVAMALERAARDGAGDREVGGSQVGRLLRRSESWGMILSCTSALHVPHRRSHQLLQHLRVHVLERLDVETRLARAVLAQLLHHLRVSLKARCKVERQVSFAR